MVDTGPERVSRAVDLCVVITTFNSARTIRQCLASVEGLATRVVVVDSGSSDGTVELCRSMGAEVTHRDWQGFAKQKAHALSLAASHEWVLLLDSDESLEPDLRSGLRAAMTSASPSVRGIEINRRMWYAGGWLRHAGFPDWVLRGGRRGALRMIDRPVHERLEADGPIIRAAGICRHDSWDGFCDAVARNVAYARLGAPLRRPPALPILAGSFGAAATLCKVLLVERGILDGWRGWSVAVAKAIGRLAASMAAYEHAVAKRVSQ